ncbi:MAG: amidohydrolase family protein [Novosphingobium sp.]|nr:amidohydrolase family protein [Novosphingobium sp.]
MSRVIDVDSHWTFAWEFEPARGPLAKFAQDLPRTQDLLAWFFAGDLIEALPEDLRPDPRVLFGLPEGEEIPEHWRRLQHTGKPADRIEWMDRVGIDFALVNPGGYGSTFPLIENRKTRADFICAANDVLLETLDGYTSRCSPIAVVDLEDIDGAIAEMTRMRTHGSRAFSIRTIPVNGMSLGHPHFDRVWSAAVDLGMLVNIHVGNVPGRFGDWANLGWDFTDLDTVGPFMRMANTQRYHGAEQFLNSMLYGGAFARHPDLTILISELWAGWLPNFIRQTEVFCAKRGPWGDWPFPMSGGDYLRRHVKLTPLPGLGDWNALDLIRDFPEIVVFSSDYPHTEGNADPIELYRPGLDSLTDEVRDGFLGDTMADCFARMGDPVVH